MKVIETTNLRTGSSQIKQLNIKLERFCRAKGWPPKNLKDLLWNWSKFFWLVETHLLHWLKLQKPINPTQSCQQKAKVLTVIWCLQTDFLVLFPLYWRILLKNYFWVQLKLVSPVLISFLQELPLLWQMFLLAVFWNGKI